MEILKLREHRELLNKASVWFHSKWGIPVKAYEESIKESLKNTGIVPQWYIVLEDKNIVGGAEVIENDFPNRKDWSPNVCSFYVEKEHRYKGIAGKLLQYVCDDINSMGIDTLYLITDHTSFYERYGWTFLCMVQEDGEPDKTRMYIRKNTK